MLKIFDKYNPNANPANTDYPNGSGRDETVSGANDGTPLEMDWYNDMLGYSEALLREGRLSPSGNPDTALVSDRLTGLRLSTIRTHVASNYADGDVSAVSVIYVGLDLSTVDYVIDRSSFSVWVVGSVTGTVTADDLNTSTGVVSGASSPLTSIKSLSDLSAKRVTHNFSSDNDYTLTATQNLYGTIVITDSGALLTGDRTITVSNEERALYVKNETSHRIKVITDGSTGIHVESGEIFSLYVSTNGVFTNGSNNKLVVLPNGAYSSVTQSYPYGITQDDIDEVQMIPLVNVSDNQLIGSLASINSYTISSNPTNWSLRWNEDLSEYSEVSYASSTSFSVSRGGDNGVKSVIIKLKDGVTY